MELGPLILFFVSYQVGSRILGKVPNAPTAFEADPAIAWSTGILMVAVSIAMAVNYALERKIPIVAAVSGALAVVFGALTLFMHDDFFIKIKPTVANLLMATGLLVGLALGRPLIKLVMESAITLPDFAWRTLSWRFALWFIFLAGLNEYMWRNYDYETWQAFKVWGVFPLSLAFTMSQLPYISKHAIEPESETPK